MVSSRLASRKIGANRSALGVTSMPSLAQQSASSIEEHLKNQLLFLDEPGQPVSRYERVRHWCHFADEYILASKHLKSQPVPQFRPWIQVSGHAVECAAKAYLCAFGKREPKDHDLVKLLDLGIDLGLSVGQNDLAILVHLNHLYSRDLRSGTRYKARYPPGQWEPFIGTIPNQALLVRVVSDFCGQSRAANERLNRAAGKESSDPMSDTKQSGFIRRAAAQG